MLRSRRSVLGSLVGFSTAAALPQAAAQGRSASDGPLKIITSIPSGAGPDALLRLVADRVGKLWGQPPAVVNMPGAAGLIAARAALSARPDGQTLFMALASTYVSLPVMQPNLPFDMNAFVPVGLVGEVPMLIAASPDLPVRSLSDLLALAKARPEGITVASAATPGEMPELTLDLLRSRSGAKLTPVLYSNPSAALTDVMSGRVAAILDGLAGPAGRSQGQLKLLAVASSNRLPSRPNLPTIAETLPGFSASGWWVLVAPPGTPDRIAQPIGDDLRSVLAQPDLQQRFEAFGAVTRALSPPELAAFIRAEQDLWKPFVQAGMKRQADDGNVLQAPR